MGEVSLPAVGAAPTAALDQSLTAALDQSLQREGDQQPDVEGQDQRAEEAEPGRLMAVGIHRAGTLIVLSVVAFAQLAWIAALAYLVYWFVAGLKF